MAIEVISTTSRSIGRVTARMGSRLRTVSPATGWSRCAARSV